MLKKKLQPTNDTYDGGLGETRARKNNKKTDDFGLLTGFIMCNEKQALLLSAPVHHPAKLLIPPTQVFLQFTLLQK